MLSPDCCDIENLQTICYIIKRAPVNFYCPSELLLSFIVSTLLAFMYKKCVQGHKNIQIPTFIECNLEQVASDGFMHP